MNIVDIAQATLALVVGSPGGGLARWWCGIVDSWFSITIAIGVVALIVGAVASIIKTAGKGTSK